MSRPPRLAVALWVAAGLCAVGGVFWWFLLREDVPQRAALPERASVVSLPEAPAEPGSDVSGSGQEGSVDGTWQVVATDSSFVGYRATERWAAESFDKSAVGRTTEVEGTVRVRDGVVEAADIRADLSGLTSDQSARDALLRTSWLDSDRFPEARFRLAEPIVLPDDLEVGQVVDVSASGDMALRGRTRDVEVQLRARWNGATIDLAGSTVVVLSAFDVQAPSTPFITVDDEVEVELQLVLARPAR